MAPSDPVAALAQLHFERNVASTPLKQRVGRVSVQACAAREKYPAAIKVGGKQGRAVKELGLCIRVRDIGGMYCVSDRTVDTQRRTHDRLIPNQTDRPKPRRGRAAN